MNISVIIPVYNAERFLEKAVDSALQFSEVKEILLIEDASPDKSLNVCKSLVEKYPDSVQLFQHPDKGNHGAGASRNLGLEKASQDFIAFLDADDYYLPNRFDAEKELFKNKKIEGVFNAIGTEFLSEEGKTAFKEKFNNIGLTTVKNPAEGLDVFYGLLGLTNDFGTFFHLNGLTIHRKSLIEKNLRFNPDLRVHQDSDFIIKLSYQCYLKSGNISQAVAIRGVHDDNRITKIQNYSEKYNQRQKLVWTSIYDWAEDKALKPEYKEHILLKKTAYNLALKTGSTKFFSIIKNTICHPKILKTRYRFTYLGK